MVLAIADRYNYTQHDSEKRTGLGGNEINPFYDAYPAGIASLRAVLPQATGEQASRRGGPARPSKGEHFKKQATSNRVKCLLRKTRL